MPTRPTSFRSPSRSFPRQTLAVRSNFTKLIARRIGESIIRTWTRQEKLRNQTS